MRQQIERALDHMGETRAMANHDHDLVQELSKRLDAVWRYDQYIANAEDKPELQDFWRQIKRQDREVIDLLKELIGKEIQNQDF